MKIIDKNESSYQNVLKNMEIQSELARFNDLQQNSFSQIFD